MNTLLRLRLVLVCYMALGLSTIAAFGQAATSPTTTTDQTTAGQTANASDRDNHSNWGWIGLVGLLGLGGLMKRRDDADYNRVRGTDTRREARV